MNESQYIFHFELKDRLRSASTYIYAAVIIILSIVAFNLDIVQAGFTSRSFRNSPITIGKIITLFNNFGVFIIGPIIGLPLLREHKHNFNQVYYSLPISTERLFSARFLSSFCYLIFSFTGIYVGIAIGTLLPGIDAATTTNFHFLSYANSFILYLLPNLFITSTIIYSITSFYRKEQLVYVLPVILFLLQLTLTVLADNASYHQVIAFLDPLGIEATEYVTQYWTIDEQNFTQLPWLSLIGLNRLIWLLFSLLLFLYARRRYSFSLKASPGKNDNDIQALFRLKNYNIPVARFANGIWFEVKITFRGAFTQFVAIARSLVFWVFVSGGIFFLYVDQWFSDRVQGVLNYPVTFNMISVDQFAYVFFAYAVILFYTGEVLWKERSSRFNLLADALPTSNSVLLFQKFLAVTFVSLVLVILVFVSGIITQSLKGYYNYELDLYFKQLMFITLPDFLFFQVMAFAILVLVNQRFVGYFIVIVSWALIIALPRFGISHPLAIYSSLPPYVYSDMNGYGHFPKGIFWFNFYWTLVGLLPVLFSIIIWPRGNDSRRLWHIKNISERMLWKVGFILILITGVGGYLFYQTNVLGRYATEHTVNELKAKHERTYSKYKNLEQLKIISVDVNTDIFPSERKVIFKGKYDLENKSTRAIDYLHIVLSNLDDLTTVNLSKPFSIQDYDTQLNYAIYTLDQPIYPGQKLQIDFEVVHQRKGISAILADTEIVQNGSVINQSHLPSIGYQPDNEISDNNIRKKYGLKPKTSPKVDNPKNRNVSFASNDADWIDFNTVVSTSIDQIAVAPGELVKSWSKNNRNYFHYKFDCSLKALSWISGEFKVVRDKWTYNGNEVDLEILYHPKHDYNISRMMKSLKSSLSYYSKNFSPYQFNQLRIVEFPRFAQGAFSLPGLIPFSESFSFILKVDEGDVDIPFHITAHEVAHQWWGYQVVPANAQGARFIAETMAQYSAARVLEGEYGKDILRTFLKEESRRYLLGHARSGKNEPPSHKVENESFVHSKKGSIVTNAIASKMGINILNEKLSSFIKQFAFKNGPYPTSLNLIDQITSGSEEDGNFGYQLKNILLYDLKFKNAGVIVVGDSVGLTLELDLKKFNYHDDSEKPITIDDPIRVEIRDKNNTVLFNNYIYPPYNRTFYVLGWPHKIILDPDIEFIERNRTDNSFEIK